MPLIVGIADHFRFLAGFRARRKNSLHSSTKAQESLWQVFHQVGCNEAVPSEARGSSITGKGMKRNT